MKKDIPNHRGRPPDDKELRKLRSSIWYEAVKSVDNLNDSQLDALFGTSKGEEPRVGADRIKMFEAIRVNRSIPSNGNNGRRNYDLVARVDAHPGYKGTAAIIQSPLWRLMEKKPISLKELREMILQLFITIDSTYEVVYLDVEGADFLQPREVDDLELFFEQYFKHQSEAGINYYNSITNLIDHFEPTLDRIALLTALSFEAIEGGNMTAAAHLIKSLRIRLKEYCEEEWLGNLGKELYKFVSCRIRDVLNKDNLHDLPTYGSMLSILSNGNDMVLNSPVAKFLQLHQQIVWRKNE